MPRKQTPAVESESLSGAALARLLGVSRSTPGKWSQEGCPRNQDGSFSLPAVVQWRVDRAANTDPMLSGGDSPATERYRLAKARLAELELGERRRALLPRAVVHEALARLGVMLRGFGERLATDPAAKEHHADLHETLDDFDRDVARAFSPENERN